MCATHSDTVQNVKSRLVRAVRHIYKCFHIRDDDDNDEMKMSATSPFGPVGCGQPLRGARRIHINHTRPS
jgi:hypothetical protein